MNELIYFQGLRARADSSRLESVARSTTIEPELTQFIPNLEKELC